MRKPHVFALRWFIPAIIVLTFLILPDLVTTSDERFLRPSWLERAFFTIFVINPLLGAAKAISDPESVRVSFERYRQTDPDTLRILVTLGDVVFTLGAIVVFLYALSSTYPSLGAWKYLIASSYALVVGATNYPVHRMKLAGINKYG